MTSYNQVIAILQAMAEAHLQINTFGEGDPWDKGDEVQYPLMWVTPRPSFIDTERKGSFLRLNIVFADRTLEDDSNEQEVHSDMHQVATDIISQLQESDSFTLEPRVPLEPFSTEDPDIISGWIADVELRIDYLSDHCGIPSDYTEGELSSPCQPASLLNTDGSYAASAPAGQSFIIPDIRILKEDGSLLRTYPAVKNPTIQNSNVQNTDGSYAVEVAAEGSLILPDSTLYKEDLTVLRLLPATQDDIILDADIRNSDSSYQTTVEAEGLKVLPDITLTDVLGNAVVFPSVKNISATQYSAITAQQHEDNLSVIKRQQLSRRGTQVTGITTPRQAGDDGTYKIGVNPTWSTLDLNNSYGNTNRFFDQSGTQIYVDNIVIDYLNNKMIYRVSVANGTIWTAARDAVEASVIGGYTDWRMLNEEEFHAIINKGSVASAPFNFIPNSSRYWTNSMPSATTVYVVRFFNDNTFQIQPESISASTSTFCIMIRDL